MREKKKKKKKKFTQGTTVNWSGDGTIRDYTKNAFQVDQGKLGGGGNKARRVSDM